MSPAAVLPAGDVTGAAYSGWSRQHWELTANEWLRQIRVHTPDSPARPRLPGQVTRDGPVREGMETICRSAILAAALLAGGRVDADEHAAWYRQAIIDGTRPGGPHAWPRAVNCRAPLAGITQSLVEAAHLSFALYIGRSHLWDPLPADQKRQVADWLRHHAQLEAWYNNWQLFPAVCEAFLTSVGEPTPGCHGARNVARVESWYLGQGWYTDGPERAIDYYTAWTIHPLLWAWYRMTGRDQTADGDRHRQRLGAFAEGFPAWMAADGSLLHMGRSVCYRTAPLAALWCAEFAGVNPWTPGQTRRLASGVVSRFVDRGMGSDGLLTLGWYQTHAGSCQPYSGFGSPYLAGIGFLGLALGADHPVWTSAEEPLPIDDEPGRLDLPEAGWTVNHHHHLSRLTNHGSDHCGLPVGGNTDPDDPHYAKFSYSTHTAPGTGRAWRDNIDSHLALVDSDGRATRRCALHVTRAESGIAGSLHLPQLDGRLLDDAWVVTVSIEHGQHELRCHLVRGRADLTVREGAHAIADGQPPRSGTVDQTGTAWARNSEGTLSAVTPVIGWQASQLHHYVGCNALGRHSTVGALTAPGSPDRQVFAALHTLSRAPLNPAELGSAVVAQADQTTIAVRWKDDHTTTTVDLADFVTDADAYLACSKRPEALG